MQDRQDQSNTEIALLAFEDMAITISLSTALTAVVDGVAYLLGIPLEELVQYAG